MEQKIYQVDAFTHQPFRGNPAAVCLLREPAEEAWMISVAAEMNLSETAFVLPEAAGFNLRWFTPKREVHLCGHATLASAHLLWETGVLQPGEQARFSTLSGLLTAELCGDWIEMDFSTRELSQAEPPEGLAEALGFQALGLQALGIQPVYTGRTGNNIYLLEAASEAAVRGLAPDFTRLAGLPVRSVIVTARSETPGFDFVSRYFAPSIGVNEDPVTGSAHCALTPYWSAKLGKNEMTAYQASARGGEVRVRLAGERVKLCGQAVTVLSGTLH